MSMNSKRTRTLNVQTNTMADRCERCVGDNVKPDPYWSKIVDYAICEECYNEILVEAEYFEIEWGGPFS